MTKQKIKTNIPSKWFRFLSSWQPPKLPQNPLEFITKFLGYDLMPFHQKWWEFQSKNNASLLLAPRGHGKSTILTIAFSLFSILNNPNLRILIVSNTAAQAEAFLREIKHHLENNPRITTTFGQLKDRPWSSSQIGLTPRHIPAKETTITAMGVMGPVISKHYEIIILDDVVDEEAARSKTMRNKLETWYYKELLPTLEPHGEIHIIGTRYHNDDLYGKLIESDMPVLVERALIEKDGKEEALWEKKFSLELLRKKREQAGPAIFNTQYQNDVSAMKGRIFRPEWIVSGAPHTFTRKYQGVDLAIGTGDHNDYFAHVTIGEYSPGHFQVIGVYRGRLSFEDQFRTIQSLFIMHDRPDSPVVTVGIEANSYQEALVQRVRSDTMIPVKSITQTRDKIARAMRLQGLFQTKRISFLTPSRMGHVEENKTKLFEKTQTDSHLIIEELLSFPDSDHDDLVDALEISVRMALETARYNELPVRDLDIGPTL